MTKKIPTLDPATAGSASSSGKASLQRKGARGLVVAVLAAGVIAGSAACEPAPTKCKTTLHKYDHSTLVVTWFTLYNEMRFCYDGTRATDLEWTNNRTSNPAPGAYTKGAVTTSASIETYEGSRKRARNVSTHTINCLQILSGFDVTMRQLGYGDGQVTKWRSSINNLKDC